VPSYWNQHILLSKATVPVTVSEQGGKDEREEEDGAASLSGPAMGFILTYMPPRGRNLRPPGKSGPRVACFCIKKRVTGTNMAQAVNSMSNTGNAQLIVMNSKEKDDLHESLPSEWTTPQHLGQATIYNMHMSPPCCKIRTIFAWYKVTRQHVLLVLVAWVVIRAELIAFLEYFLLSLITYRIVPVGS
jgi:hypothetical protein